MYVVGLAGNQLVTFGGDYKERTDNGDEAGRVMDDLGLERYCCRASMLGHVELIDITAQFKKF